MNDPKEMYRGRDASHVSIIVAFLYLFESQLQFSEPYNEPENNIEIQNNFQINGGASFRWSFGPLSAWDSIVSTPILTTHPSL